MKRILRLLSVVAMLMIASNASAQTYVALQDGANELPAYQSNIVARYRTTQDCSLTISCRQVYKVTCDGVEYSYNWLPANDYAYVYTLKDIKRGHMIELSTDFVMNGGIFVETYTGEFAPIKFLGVSPSADNTFSWTNAGNMTVQFNKNVSMKNLSVVIGGRSYNATEVSVSNGMIGLNVKNAISQAYLNGAKEGDGMDVVFTGIYEVDNTANLYNGDGNLTIHYLLPAEQHTVSSAVIGGVNIYYAGQGGSAVPNNYELLSYYDEKGTDGVLVLTFDGDVKSVGSVRLNMGNLDKLAEGGYYMETLPYRIEGNKIIVDMRGKLRTIRSMFPNASDDILEAEDFDLNHVTIIVSDVVDRNGNSMASEAQGSVGSYAYVVGYRMLESNVVIDGDNIAEGDEVNAEQLIKIWISDAEAQFDYVEVAYKTINTEIEPDADGNYFYNTKTLKVTDFTTEPDPAEGQVISFVMPAIAEAVVGQPIVVTLAGAKTSEGLPVELYITFVAGEGIASGINNIEADKKSHSMYNILGQRVKNTKGIVIVDGKKIIKK